MRKIFLLLALIGALAVTASAAAIVSPPILCGAQSCSGGGGGWTGCTSQTASHSASVSFLANINHYLVVSYCKRYGIITSISIAAHGCDVSGLVACHLGPAWMTGGGVGSTSATFEAHATWNVTTLPLVNNNDVVTLTVPAG